MTDKTIDIEELVQDDHRSASRRVTLASSKNLNKGTEPGERLMEKSFKELGAGRSILQ